MKITLYTTTLIVCFFLDSPILDAQCPPPGFPQPGGNCPTAPILCENLDGYCATINNNNTTQTFPGCPGWTLNNDEWFAFFAGTTTISIQVTPSNCSSGGQQGLQGGIYAGCGPPWTAMDLQCSCTENPFILSSTNFVVGQVYWIVLDGCAGNVCDYAIDVLEGSTVGFPPADPGPITGPVEVCQGTSSAYSIAAVTGATIYNWTITPSGLGTITGSGPTSTVNWGANASGTATICVDVANLCFPLSGAPLPTCITVDINPKPTATISGSGIVCGGTGNPANLTVTFTGEGPWSFVHLINGVPQAPIVTSNNPYTLQVTQPGTYTLQGVSSTGNGCVGTVSGTAVVTQSTVTVATNVTNSQCGLSNGAINITPGGGTAPYTYIWSNSQTTEDLTNIPAGNYTVTVTSANGCTAVQAITVGDNVIALNVTGVVVANTTCNGGNGSIDVSVNPAGSYTYNWSNSATTQDLTGLEPGTYTVTVTSGTTCSGTASFTVNDNPNPPTVTSTVVGTSCDFSNGSINVSVSGGVSPYTFIWSGSQTTEDLTNIPAGSYSVTVTGANGCTSVANVTVPNNNPPININGNVVANSNCNSNNNGSITITVTPPGTYTYTWSNSATTQNLTNLPPGTYTVTVSAGGTCTQTASFTVPDTPNNPSLNSSTVPSTCDLNNGSINLTPTGGVPPYTFSWSNSATTQNLNNIPAGTYSVTVTGANGCTSTANITVANNNPPINVTATVMANTNCNGNNTGSINVTVAPAGTYTYIWSNNATTQDLNNLPAGTYTVTVSAGGSCTQIASFTVPDDPNEPNITFTPLLSSCDLSNGGINVSVSGGVPPYAFLWSNNATTQNLANILAGTYSLTVTGANGCTSTVNVTVPNNNPPIDITSNITPNTACVGTFNGSINVTVTPPAAYTYIWSNNATTQDLNNLPTGTYFLTVSAGGTCTATAAFVVPDDPNAPDLSFTFVPATCGLSNGSINLTVIGGIPPYTYQWSSGQITQDISNIPGDIYSVIVTGANGCTALGGVSVPNNDIPITLNATVNPKTSCITNNGSIMLSLTPANLSVLWSNNSTSPNLNNLAPGTYSVTVSAGGNCTETASFTIDDATEPPNLSIEVTPSTCSFNNGAIDLEVDGGQTPYTYKWQHGPMTQDLINLAANTFTVTVTTALGCTATTSATVPNNPIAIDILGIVSDNVSCTTPNGFIDLNIEPQGNNYTYLWSNGKTTPMIQNLTPGAYTVIVTWGSCVNSATFDVFDQANPPNLSVVGIPATCGLNNGGADATVSGGSSPYTYHWSTNAATQDLNNIAPGPYSLTVTDFYNCSTTATVNVANNNIALNISGVVTENTSCVAANGGVNIAVSPTGSYVYNWSNTSTTEDLNNLAAGTYTVTVTSGVSCSATATFTVTNNTTNPVISPAVTAAICGNSNGAIDLTVSGATTPYIFAWSNSATSEDLVNILSGNYTVTVTAANGCTADTTLNVPNNSSTFSLSGTALPLTNCAANNGTVDLTVTPAGPYTYLWSNNATTQDLTGLPAGTYTVSVTETGNCVASASFIVNDERTYPATSQTVSPEICGLSNGSVNLEVSGGQTPYAFQWAGGQMTEDLINIADGTYSVVVTDANGCTTTATANVPENSVSFSISGTPSPNTSCIVNDGSISLSLSPTDPGAGLGYTFIWSNNATTQNLNNIAPGPYEVTVSAGGTCTSTATYTVANAADAPSVSESITPAFCGQNSGDINLTVTGGQSPYTFLWTGGQTTEDLGSLTSGDYSVTVSGANSCKVVETFTVPENTVVPSISGIITPSTSCIANNGGVSISVSPPLAYTFTWSNGQTSQDLINVSSGTYTLTVNGGGACVATATFTVGSDVGTVSLSGSATDILCFGENTGAVNLTIGGGTQPYNINWSPAFPGNQEDLSNLVAGNYSVTVTDQLGCSASANFTVNQPAAAVQIVCSQSKNVSFPGAGDGAGTVNLSGGTAPYTIVWSPGGSQSNVVPGNFAINNLSEGSYAVTVTDVNGCTALCNFAVSILNCETAVGTMSGGALSLCGPGCLTASYNPIGQFLEPDDVLQFVLHTGSSNQIVNEIARNSQPVFCFDETKMSYGTTYYISAIAGNNDGTGNVTLAHFCTVVSFGTPIVFKEKPVAGIAQPEPITCAVLQVNLSGSSSIPNSVFAWNTLTGIIVGNAAQAVVTAGSAGDYTLIVNANGCFDTTAVQVKDLSNQPVATIFANPSDILDCTISEIVLSGQVEGTLSANTIWISGGVVYANGTVLPIVNPGTYQFVILDTLTFCTDTAVITINENLAYPPLFLNPPGLLTCANDVVTLTGGSPLPGIDFVWITVNGADTTVVGNGTSISVSAPGVYYLIGMDPLNSCTNFLTETVNADLEHPVADAGTPFSIECFGETASLDGSGSSGQTGLTFLWTTSNGHLVNGILTQAPQIDKPGTYALLVTNPGNGCTDTDEVVINPKSPVASATVNQPPCFGDKGSILVDSITGGKPPIRYSLDGGPFTTQNFYTGLNPGTYSLVVQDALGCSTTLEAVVIAPVLFDISVEPQVTVKLGDTYQINTEVSVPLSEIGTINWTPSTGLSCDTCLNPIAEPLQSTRYVITATNKEGCKDSAPLLMFVDKQVDVYVPNIFSPNNDGENDVFMIFADTKGVTKIKTLQVYSRWGELVFELYNFEPNNPALGWNGKHREKELNPAVFVWYAVIEFVDGSEVLYEGDVTLKR